MNTTFSKALQIKEPGGIHLNDGEAQKDRAPIDISITRSNTISFPWENTIGLLPDDMDVFKQKIKTALNIDPEDWNSFNLAELTHNVKANDKFFYTVVQFLNTDNAPALNADSKVLIYDKLAVRYYEPYYATVEEGKTVYQLFIEEDFEVDTIKNTFSRITHLRAVYKPQVPDLPDLDQPIRILPVNSGNPINGGLLNFGNNNFSGNFNGGNFNLSGTNPSENLDLSAFDRFSNLSSNLASTISVNGSDYISGVSVKTILDQAKASHAKTEADPIKLIVKKPSVWESANGLKFYTLKEDIDKSMGVKSDLLLLYSELSAENFNLFYKEVTDEKNWIAKLNDRYYQIELEQENEAFNTLDAFFSSWEDEVKDISLVAYKKGSNETINALPANRYFDVTLSAIMDQYQDIQAQKEFSGGRKKLADSLISKTSNLADFEYEEFTEALSQIEEKHHTLINANINIEREERTLKDRLKKFGYQIRTASNGNPEIFKTYEVVRLIKVAVRVKRRVRVRFGPFTIRVKTRWYTHIPKHIKVPVDKVITVPETPWSKEVDQLKENGYNVYFLELTKQGYVTETGESLNEIMRYCELSETIRLKTAVMIPQYEQSVTKGLRLIGYDLFTRPLPGDIPTSVPDLSLEESLAYRASWKGTELSELIESINLAPGESRNIAIKQTFESQKTQTQSVTSILDVTEKQASTFTDFFEQTNRKSKETVTNKSWSAKASGSYGGFGGSASGGGSTKQTSKSFAQQIKRAANTSSREMKKQSRVEINSKLTESSKLVIDESISSQIQNINDGVSLNLFFYRLDNVYQGGLHLEDLKITYTRPQPLIKDTNLMDIRTFEFYEFEDFLNMVSNDTVLVLSGGLTDMELELKEVEIRFSIVFRVFKKIFKEYFYNVPEEAFINYPESLTETDLLISGESIDANKVSNALSLLVKRIKKQQKDYEKVRAKLATYIPDNATWWKEYKKLFTPLQEVQVEIEEAAYQLLNGIEYNYVPISGSHLFSIPSNGAYLDCVVGSSSGLEPYSENMRTQELNRQKAEIEMIQAQSYRLKGGNIKETYPLDGISIQDLELDEQSTLIIKLNKALPTGNWSAKVNGVLFPSEVSSDRNIVSISQWENSLENIEDIKLVEYSGVTYKD